MNLLWDSKGCSVRAEEDESWYSASLPREPLQQPVPADPSISLQARRGERLFEGSASHLIPRLNNPILVVAKDNYSPLMVEHPGLAAAICIAQHQVSIWRKSSWKLITMFVQLAYLGAILCSHWILILLKLHPLRVSTPTPCSSNEQGKEWLTLIESARTFLALFSLQKHAHVTLTFFIVSTRFPGENV